ncbi:MAG: hypothetical protein IJD31_00125, partial [Lachnospiraceae bacterium]|nr:hypothetical protein [Lachnospiraceae bacterium]
MMKGKLKKAICMALATTMVISMTACFGKDGGGDTSDALAQASDSANAKEAVFKEIGSINPEAEWFDDVLVDGEEVIVVWSEYMDIYGEGGDVAPGGEAVPYEEGMTETPATEEMPEAEQEAITEDVATEGEGVDSVVIVDDPMMPMPEVEYMPEEEYSFYYKLNLGRVSFGGTGMSVTTIELPEKEYSCGIEIDPSTGNYVIMTERTIEDYSNPDNYSYETHWYMNVYSKSGELVSREEIKLGNNPDEYFGIYGMGIAANGDICLLTDRTLVVLNSSLQKVGQVAFSDNQWVESFFVSSDGVPYVYIWTEGGESS